MKAKLLFLLSVAGLGLATLVPARAQEAGTLRQQAREKLADLRDDLGLDATQKEKIRDILVSHKAELLAQWQLGKSARDTMQSAVKDHGAGSPEATAAANGIGEVAKKRALLVASIAQEVKPVLTPEQIKKLETAKEGLEKWLQEKMLSGRS